MLWLIAAAAALSGAAADALPCERLASLSLPDAAITRTQLVAAGEFSASGGRAGRTGDAAYGTLPAFCRVEATVTPSRDSSIGLEIWLPVAGAANRASCLQRRSRICTRPSWLRATRRTA
jgi:hypothetical protein